MLHGAARHDAAVRDLTAAIADLQQKVESLTQVIVRLDGQTPKALADSAQALQHVEAMRTQLRTITDDLGDRVGAISARLESLGR